MLTPREFLSLATLREEPPWATAEVPTDLWKGEPRSLRKTIEAFENLNVVIYLEIRPLVLPVAGETLDQYRRNFRDIPASKAAVEALARAIEPFGGVIIWLSEGYRKVAIRGPYASLIKLPGLEIDDLALSGLSALRSDSAHVHIQGGPFDKGGGEITVGGVLVGAALIAFGLIPEPGTPVLIGLGVITITGGFNIGVGFSKALSGERTAPSPAAPPNQPTSAAPNIVVPTDGEGGDTAIFGEEPSIPPELLASLDEIILADLPIDPSQFVPGDPMGGGLTPGRRPPQDPGVQEGDGTGIPGGIF